jgi:hypothetical protein
MITQHPGQALKSPGISCVWPKLREVGQTEHRTDQTRLPVSSKGREAAILATFNESPPLVSWAYGARIICIEMGLHEIP